MAQARQEVEEYQASMMSCLGEYGIEYQAAPGSEVLILGSATMAPGEEERQGIALQECGERVPLPSMWSWTPDDGAYQRMLDVRECLIAQGYELPEAPSESTWLEASSFWNPYDEFTGPDALYEVSRTELENLRSMCPQSGQGLIAEAYEE